MKKALITLIFLGLAGAGLAGKTGDGGVSATSKVKSDKGVIHVTVTGLKNTKGKVRAALFANKEDFPTKAEKALQTLDAEIIQGETELEFKGIPPGVYAISVFHDEAADGKLKLNFFGIPLEGVGASNDAQGMFGPPSFSKAAFTYAGGILRLYIPVHY